MSTITNNALSTNLTNIYNRNQSYMAKALTQTASGQRIVSAKDGPSDWAISERMLERTYSLQQNKRNVQNGSAMLKTAEGGIQNSVDILTTIKERILNAANEHNNADDITIIQQEITSLVDQLDSNVANVKFNGKQLLDGTYAGSTGGAGGAGGAGGTNPTPVTYDFSGSSPIPLTGDGGTTKITNDDVLSALNEANANPNDNDTVDLSTLTKLSSTGGTGNADRTAVTGTAKYTTSGGNTWYLDGGTGVAPVNLTVYYSNTPTTTGGSGSGTTATAGSGTGNLVLQVGDEDGLTVSLNIQDMSSSTLFGGNTIDVTTAAGRTAALTTIDTALTNALQAGTQVGSAEQRLGYVSDNIDTQIENIENSYSTIREADMAKTVTDYMKYTVLSQAAQFMLAQNNQNASSVFTLLQP